MKRSSRFALSVYGPAVLALLMLAACGSQPTNTGSTVTVTHPTPTPTPTNAPTPTPIPAPTTIPGTPLGGNLIVNGNAEQGQCAADSSTVISPITGWTPTGNITPIQYAASNGDLNATTPGPGDAGKCYFWGGPSNPASSMTQKISVASFATQIDSKTVMYDLSAWLGGYADQNDNAVLSIQFLDTTGKVLGTAQVGPVMAADRNDTSELLPRATSGAVPASTRAIQVTLTMTRTDGSDNDGLADDLSLLLVQQGGSASGTPTATPTP